MACIVIFKDVPIKRDFALEYLLSVLFKANTVTLSKQCVTRSCTQLFLYLFLLKNSFLLIMLLFMGLLCPQIFKEIFLPHGNMSIKIIQCIGLRLITNANYIKLQ